MHIYDFLSNSLFAAFSVELLRETIEKIYWD